MQRLYHSTIRQIVLRPFQVQASQLYIRPGKLDEGVKASVCLGEPRWCMDMFDILAYGLIIDS